MMRPHDWLGEDRGCAWWCFDDARPVPVRSSGGETRGYFAMLRRCETKGFRCAYHDKHTIFVSREE